MKQEDWGVYLDSGGGCRVYPLNQYLHNWEGLGTLLYLDKGWVGEVPTTEEIDAGAAERRS